MAFDEDLAERVRHALCARADFEERRMFGGLAFLVGGHMTVGVVASELMARVGPQGYPDALREPHAREMDFTGVPLRGLVFVGEAGIRRRADLEAWIDRALAFVRSLPPKSPAARKRRKSAR